MSYAEKFEKLRSKQGKNFVCCEIEGVKYVDYGTGQLVPLTEMLERLPALDPTPQDWTAVLEGLLNKEDISTVEVYEQDTLTAEYFCMLAGFNPPVEKELQEFLTNYCLRRKQQLQESYEFNSPQPVEHIYCEQCHQCTTCNECVCEISIKSIQ